MSEVKSMGIRGVYGRDSASMIGLQVKQVFIRYFGVVL